MKKPEPRRQMTKSPVAVARAALKLAERAMPAYGHKNAPKKFTQHQLFALLVLRKFLDVDYRGMEETVRDWSDLREALGLEGVPDFSTLCRAEERLLKKGASMPSLPKQLHGPGSVASSRRALGSPAMPRASKPGTSRATTPGAGASATR